MLSFPVRSVVANAVPVKGNFDRDDAVWQESDGRPRDAVSVTGRLSAAGVGLFYFSGRFAGVALGECRRCLIEVETPVDTESHLIYADLEMGSEDDPDVYETSRGRGGDNVDLRFAIREQWLLEVPAFVLCRPDCKGLCPTCGANLNQGACSCAQKTNE